MIFRLAKLFLGTGGLARGETPRRTIEFVVMGTSVIRGVRKSAFAAHTNACE